MQLKDPALLRKDAFVDGAWIGADSGKRFAVTNPANGARIAEVPDLGAAETKRAIAAANAAYPAWRAKSGKERAGVLRAWFNLLMANADDLAAIMVTEQGKPLAEAKGEVAYGASFVEWFAEEAKRVYGDSIPTVWGDKRLFALKEPIGVCAAITPWNFPIAMITRKIAPALAAGCTVVAKPAEQTPLSALAIAELAQRAGLPKGVLNVVTGDAAAIGGELTSNPDRAQTLLHRLDRDRQAADAPMRRHGEEESRSSSAATRRSSCSTTPISTPRWKAPSPRSTATRGRPASAPTAS